ncbi:antibiotic biosynthesis monooxygenase [Vibrio sp. PP-XX7]
MAEQLKPLLSDIDGFISIERFQSTTNPDKFISLSWWKDEEAIKHWKKMYAESLLKMKVTIFLLQNQRSDLNSNIVHNNIEIVTCMIYI